MNVGVAPPQTAHLANRYSAAVSMMDLLSNERGSILWIIQIGPIFSFSPYQTMPVVLEKHSITRNAETVIYVFLAMHKLHIAQCRIFNVIL